MSQIKDFPPGSPGSSDLLLYQSAIDNIYRHCAINQLPFGSSGSASGWTSVTTDYTAKAGDKIISYNTSGDLHITLPVVSSGNPEIDIFNLSSGHKTFVNLGGSKLQSVSYADNLLALTGNQVYTNLIYIDSTIGWIQLSGTALSQINSFPTDMVFYLEGGSLTDKSSFGHNASPSGSTSPTVATGINGKQVFRWNGSGTQQLQVAPFLSGTIGATAYCVFTINGTNNYNLIRTANLDDYWRFANDGNGYIGTFLSSRDNSYPSGMPSSGNHLISIHANSSSYEVLLDNVSKGVESLSYSPGDRFYISTNDKTFVGDIALVLVYPSYIDKSSTKHSTIIQTITNNYPALGI